MAGERFSGTSPWTILERPNPLPLEKGLARDLMLAFVAKGERDLQRELTISDTMYATHIAGKPSQEAFQAYINLTCTLNRHHFQFGRKNEPNSVYAMNAIYQNLAEQMGVDYGESTGDIKLHGLANQASTLSEVNTIDAWYYPKVGNLQASLLQGRLLSVWLEAIRGPLKFQVDGEREEDIRANADSIWKNCMENRAYGVKSCFFVSPLFIQDQINEFFILDENMGTEDRTARAQMIPGRIAILGIGPVPIGELKAEVVRPKPLKMVEGTSVNTYSFQIGGESKIFKLMPLTQTGEITSSLLTVFPMRRFFDRKGMGKEYEMWRLFMMMRVHDLIGEPKYIEKLPSIKDFEEEALIEEKFGILGMKKRHIKCDYRRLVLPRTRPIEPEDHTEGEKRFVDKHHVTWFTRRLPAGYKATNNAISYAAEHGVILESGKTIVREHERGRGSRTELPTKAIFRNQNTKN